MSQESLHKDVGFAESHNEFQIRTLAADDKVRYGTVREKSRFLCRDEGA